MYQSDADANYEDIVNIDVSGLELRVIAPHLLPIPRCSELSGIPVDPGCVRLLHQWADQ